MPTLHDPISADTARTLIAFGHNVHAINADGATPLLVAAQRNNLEMVDVLMRAGARPEQWCGGPARPLDAATDPAVITALTRCTGGEPSPPDQARRGLKKCAATQSNSQPTTTRSTPRSGGVPT